MGKYRHYWYNTVRLMVTRYPRLIDYCSMQELIYKDAIEKALADLEKDPEGEVKKQAIKMVYFDKTHTASGAGILLNYSERTVQQWLSAFINAVGKKAGF